jgi:hypothetical protein
MRRGRGAGKARMGTSAGSRTASRRLESTRVTALAPRASSAGCVPRIIRWAAAVSRCRGQAASIWYRGLEHTDRARPRARDVEHRGGSSCHGVSLLRRRTRGERCGARRGPGIAFLVMNGVYPGPSQAWREHGRGAHDMTPLHSSMRRRNNSRSVSVRAHASPRLSHCEAFVRCPCRSARSPRAAQ